VQFCVHAIHQTKTGVKILGVLLHTRER
jgi:hypothetical protein